MAKKKKAARNNPKVIKPLNQTIRGPDNVWLPEKVDWLDSDVIYFSSERRTQHATRFGSGTLLTDQGYLSDIASHIFGRTKGDLEAEWKKIVQQIGTILSAALPVVKDFTLDEITFELGFSAEGHIVFVAKGGIQTTIKATFKRKQP